MLVSKVCQNYFHAFYTLKNHRTNGHKKERSADFNLFLARISVLSYLTIITPIAFGLTWGLSKLYGKITKKGASPKTDAKVATASKSIGSTNSNRSLKQTSDKAININSPQEFYKKALETNKKAAENGDAEAQYRVACILEKSIFGDSGFKEAVEWTEKAANQGHIQAQMDLGLFTGIGVGCERNPEVSFSWYKKAAEQGDADAQCQVGESYLYGTDVVAKDEIVAVEWFMKASEKGEKGAEHYLGYCFQKGIGVAKDEQAAVEWYEVAACKGHAAAQRQLIACYKHGIGVKQNTEEAKRWYKIFIRNNDTSKSKTKYSKI